MRMNTVYFLFSSFKLVCICVDWMEWRRQFFNTEGVVLRVFSG